MGHAEPAEIDAVGILGALRLAAVRALGALAVRPSCLILDGSHDWFTPPRQAQACLFDMGEPLLSADGGELADADLPVVVTRVKADRTCAAVAAASVLAKVERDSIMVARSHDHPRYGWHANKGYSAPEHMDALAAIGACDQHRRSWSLPGLQRDGRARVDDSSVIDLALGAASVQEMSSGG